MAENPNNPVLGKAFNETFKFYTTAETLIEAMHEQGITSDSGLIETICGIEPIGEISSNYESEVGKSWWEGTFWKLYVNGSTSNIGADDVKLTKGGSYRWTETKEKSTW